MFDRIRTSLRYKISAFMLLLSLAPFCVVGSLGIFAVASQFSHFSHRLDDSEKALQSDVVGKNLRGDASDAANEIDTAFLSMVADMRHWSEEDVVVQAAQAEDRAAKRLFSQAASESDLSAKLHGFFSVPFDSKLYKDASSYLFRQSERPDSQVVEILVTGMNGYNALLTRPVQQIDHHDEPWWKAAVSSNGKGLGLVEPVWDSNANTLVLGIALPVFDTKSGSVVGVIRALFRMDDVQKVLSQKASVLGAGIRVVDQHGRVLIDTQAALVAAPPVSDIKSGGAVDRALHAEPGTTGAGFVDQDDQLIGFAHSLGEAYYEAEGIHSFEGLNWGVLVSQPKKQAMAVLSGLIQTASEFQQLPFYLVILNVSVMVLIALIAILAALALSRGIAQPLVVLSREASRVQGGDLSTQVAIASKDEIGVLGQAFNTMIKGLREREREREIFGRVVSPEVREKLLSGELALGGQTRRVSVLFSDIRGFSTIIEKMSPDEAVSFLNEYLTEMSHAILPWGGYINNYIGDAIVVILGAPLDLPNKEHQCVMAALAMRERLAALNVQRKGRGLPPIESGIGISTGDVVAGQIGSLERLQYTVIGDAVNVAARLETLTKEYPDHPILINGETADVIKDMPDIELHFLGPHLVKGRAEEVQVYAVKSYKKDDGTHTAVS